MSETMNLFTVKDRWQYTPFGIYTPPFDKIVGLTASDGRDLWVPDKSSDYINGSGYSNGFSHKEVVEKEVDIGSVLVARLAEFFEDYLLEQRWFDANRTAEKYDCSWFAFWLKEMISGDASTDDSLDLAQDLISRGNIENRSLRLGEVGILGGSSEYHGPWVDHSFIGVDETTGLQAMGMHGPIALASQDATVWCYMETSQVVDHVPNKMYGIHLPSGTKS